MNRQTILVTALTLSLPVMAGAQVRGSAELSARAEAGASARQERSAQSGASGSAAVRATVAAGLPEAPVRRAMEERRSRGGSPASVEKAGAQAHARLKVAREALDRPDRRASQSEIAAGAEAMAAGARRQHLSKLRDSAPSDRELTASLNALASVCAAGGNGGQAASAIGGRLRSGADDGAIESFAAAQSALESARGTAGLGAGAAAGARGALGGLGGVSGSLGATAGVAGSLGGLR